MQKKEKVKENETNWSGNFLSTWNGKAIVPAILKRIFRCSDKDVEQLNVLINFLPGTANEKRASRGDKIISFARDLAYAFDPRRNIFHKTENDVHFRPQGKSSDNFPPDVYMSAVGIHIIISELLTAKKYSNVTEFAEYISHGDDTLAFSMNQKFGSVIIGWPKYNLDEYFNFFGVTTKPYLVLHGELDPQTSYSFFMQTSKTTYGPNSIRLSVPYAPHQTSFEIPFPAFGATCMMNILTSFVKTGTVDSDCMDQIPPPDFEGKSPQVQAIVKYFWGTTDLWGDDQLKFDL